MVFHRVELPAHCNWLGPGAVTVRRLPIGPRHGCGGASRCRAGSCGP
jgi:hypothetical protein